MPLSYIWLTSDITSSLPPLPIAEMGPPVLMPLGHGLSQSKVILVGSAGIHLDHDPPFASINDLSYRRIPRDIAPEHLRLSHPSPIRGAGDEDVNVVFPYQRLDELAAAGVIGGVTDYHLSILGAIKKLTELVTDLAPRMADDAKAAGADIALLVPL